MDRKKGIWNPKKKHFFSSVKVGAKGQIVIPNEVRAMFDIKPGDTLIIAAKEDHGIGLVKDSTVYGLTLNVLEKIGIAEKPEEADDLDDDAPSKPEK